MKIMSVHIDICQFPDMFVCGDGGARCETIIFILFKRDVQINHYTDE